MNILSLFDGISCGRLALERAGIPITRYFSSEIDKYAIQIAQKNYQDTVQLGNVRHVNRYVIASHEKKLHDDNERKNGRFVLGGGGSHWCDIDILLAGFPCQSFSSAGKRKGFEDERGNLFFEALRILKETQPRFFLFENVASMSKENQNIISGHLGVETILINSSLVSAQHRKRLYWCGARKEDGTYAKVPISQPEDKGLFLKDILEEVVDEKYVIKNEKLMAFVQDAINQKKKYTQVASENGEEKSLPQLARQYASWKGTYILQRPRDFNGGSLKDVEVSKAPTMSSNDWQNNKLVVDHNEDPHDMVIRRMTTTECERLQTLPDFFTASVSDSQRYKMLGNGWTVDVIAHILKEILK